MGLFRPLLISMLVRVYCMCERVCVSAKKKSANCQHCSSAAKACLHGLSFMEPIFPQEAE